MRCIGSCQGDFKARTLLVGLTRCFELRSALLGELVEVGTETSQSSDQGLGCGQGRPRLLTLRNGVLEEQSPADLEFLDGWRKPVGEVLRILPQGLELFEAEDALENSRPVCRRLL